MDQGKRAQISTLKTNLNVRDVASLKPCQENHMGQNLKRRKKSTTFDDLWMLTQLYEYYIK